MQRRAFTVIELLLVIAMIGFLAAIAFSLTDSARKRAQDTQNKTDVQQVLKAWISYSDPSQSGFLLTQRTVNQTLTTTNLGTTTGAVGSGVFADLANTGSIRPGYDTTGVYAATSPSCSANCVYAAFPGAKGDYSASALAVGKRLVLNTLADPSKSIYDGNAANIDGLFTVPDPGPTPRWFVLVQK